MAIFNGYISTNGTDYNLVLSEVDITGISGDQAASVRILDKESPRGTVLEIEGLTLDLINTDPRLPGGNVFTAEITEAQYNAINAVSAYQVVDGSTTYQYLYAGQVQLFLGPTFTPQAVTNTTDNTAFPYVDPANGRLTVDQDGTYELTVTDSDSLTSAPVRETVDINDAINLAISAIADFDPGDELTVMLTAEDHDGTIDTLTFTVNGVDPLTATQRAALIANGSLSYVYTPTSADQVYVLTAEDNRDHESTTTMTSTVNTTTITIQFIDNTPAGASLNSVADFTATGNPGDSFSGFSRIVNSSSGFRLDSATCSESGDAGSNVTCAVSGRNVNVSGTFPNSNTTVTLTVNASVTALTEVTVTASGFEAGNVGPITTPEFGPSNPSTNTSDVRFRFTFPTNAARNAGFGLISASCQSPIDISGPFTTNEEIRSSVSNDGSDALGFHTEVSFSGRFNYSVPSGSSFTQPAGNHSCSVSIGGAFFLTGTTSRVWQGVV